MPDGEILTWASVVAPIALVIVTIIYVLIVRKQVQQSEKHFRVVAIRSEIAMLMQKRYQVESDETQLRIKRAEIIGNHREAERILNERHKQCEKTIKETAERIRELEKILKNLEHKDCEREKIKDKNFYIGD